MEGFRRACVPSCPQESPSGVCRVQTSRRGWWRWGVLKRIGFSLSSSKIGFQAKYFLKTGEIDWGQVDHSVSQAIDIHPELCRYIVAFACDLTDRSGKKATGLRGWEHWNNHKKKWEMWTEKRGLSIAFDRWTKSDILDRLVMTDCRGLIEYWFNSPVFDASWFRKHFNFVKGDLDERYHPEDHVEVEAAKLFEGLARSKSFRQSLGKSFSELLSPENLLARLKRLKVKPDSKLLENMKNTFLNVRAIGDEIKPTPDALYPIHCWIERITEAASAVERLQDWLWQKEREKEENTPQHGRTNTDVYKARNLAEDLTESLKRVRSRLEDVDAKADQARAGLVVGSAGTGKSHLFCGRSVTGHSARETRYPYVRAVFRRCGSMGDHSKQARSYEIFS